MATFTITTAVNIDTLTSKAGGDTYTINGGTLTVDQDSRYGLNQTTSTTLGPVTVSATLGGSVTFDASLVRLIPYNLGAGNVPASNTTISQGSASGKLIGVYSALNVAPTASGAAMPVSGYIKIKQWNSVAYAAGLLTGLTATATGADVVGWIEVSGDDAAVMTLPRLGNPTLKLAQGAYYQIGTTDGNRATTYQIPSNGTLVYHAGVYVETSAGSGVYEGYPVTGESALAASVGTEAARGKCCWIATDGTLRFGNDGTNSTGGYVPVTGCKIVIGNVFFSTNTAASRTVNVEPNVTLATRYKFVTTGGGVINTDKISMNWGTSWTNAYSVACTNSGFLTGWRPQNVATLITADNIIVGHHSSTAAAQACVDLLGDLAGATITNSAFGHSPYVSNGFVVSIQNSATITASGNRFMYFGSRTNTTSGSIQIINSTGLTFTSNINASRILATNTNNLTVNSTSFYDTPGSTTPSTFANYAFVFNNCNTVVVDSFSVAVPGTMAYNGLINLIQSSSTGIRFRNCGTYAAPVDMGMPEVSDVAWTRVTTTATVTSTAHGLKTGDIIDVPISSVPAAIAIGQKTITVVDANTFTFAATNSGAASGTLSYFLTVGSFGAVWQNNAYTSDIRFEKCYFNHFRTAALSGANDNNNIKVANSVFDAEGGSNTFFPLSTLVMKSFLLAPFSRAAQTGVYGTIWNDIYIGRQLTSPSAQAWARSTTTATVTTTGHKLRTNDIINVTVTSDASAIVLGQKTITVVDSNTFTFTCLNAGGASGTITYKPFNGAVGIQMNESNTATSTQYTKDSGTPVFTSAGSVVMGTINDQITWVMPDYIIGHLNFMKAEAVMAGGTLTDYLITYAIDQGSGYGSFQNLSRPITATGGVSTTTTISIADTTLVAVGDYVYGTNVAPLAKITSITNSTDFVVDQANIGTVSGTLRFNHMPTEADNTSTGMKLKVRIKTLNTNTNGITSLFMYTYSTSTERAYTYNIADQYTLTLSGLQSGSDIIIRTHNSPGTHLVNVDANAGTTYAYTYYYAVGTAVDIEVYKAGYKAYEVNNYTLTAANTTLPTAQLVDSEYA